MLGMAPYFDDAVMEQLGLEVVRYDVCNDYRHPGLQKEFLVRRDMGVSSAGDASGEQRDVGTGQRAETR